jgi:gliding motility-associated-like protein
MSWRIVNTIYFLLLCASANSQNIIANNGLVQACDVSFFDQGGQNGNYLPNTHTVTTLCSSKPGNRIGLDFQKISLGKDDFLCFYDGNTVQSSQLACSYQFIPGAPFKIQSTESNTTGCITVVFHSNQNDQKEGWEAKISCIPICQPIQVNIIGPAALDQCPEKTIDFEANVTFPENGIRYQQTLQELTYLWDYGDGTSFSTNKGSHSFKNSGGYSVTVKVKDAYGCGNQIIPLQRVRVSGKPEFSVGSILNNPICQEDTLALIALVSGNSNSAISVKPKKWTFNLKGIRSDSLALPDGSGVSYESSVNFRDFPNGSILRNVQDIQGICVDMEHSWMRDLGIKLQCPNGQTIELHNHPGNFGTEVYLGEPVTTDEGLGKPIPGIGYHYCWSATASNPNWIAYANANSTLNKPFTMPQGSYQPFESFSGLLGCPLNGDWKIIVTDWWPIDNGTIFSWEVDFNPGMFNNGLDFTPGIKALKWENHKDAFDYTFEKMKVKPNSAFQAKYKLNSLDDFGCAFDTSIVINIIPKTNKNCTSCEKRFSKLADLNICKSSNEEVELPYQKNLFENSIDFKAFSLKNNTNNFASDILVSDIFPSNIRTNNTLEKVCINLESQDLSELEITLNNPSQKSITLVKKGSLKGKSLKDFCIKENGETITKFSSGISGEFQSHESFKNLEGDLLNGKWSVVLNSNKNIQFENWNLSIKPENEIKTKWFGLDNSCDNCQKVTFNSNKDFTLSFFAEDSYQCTIKDSAKITIKNSQTSFEVKSTETEAGKVLLNWPSLANATGYSIKLGDSTIIDLGMTTSFEIDNLITGDQVNAEIIAKVPSDCGTVHSNISMKVLMCTAFVLVDTIIPPSCKGKCDATVLVSAFNGRPPFQYLLDDNKLQNIGNFNNLCAGWHNIAIEDANGCKDTVFFEIINPLEYIVSITEDSIQCRGGRGGFTADASGGQSPYTYAWNTIPTTFNPTLSNRTAGTYILTVTDSKGCPVIRNLTLNQPSLISVSFALDSVQCFGGTNGRATATASGGNNGTYSYSWSNTQNTATATNLSANSYTVTVTDRKNCTQQATVTIPSRPAVEITLSRMDPVCNEAKDGKALVATIKNGIPPYSYLWSNGDRGPVADSLNPGIASVVLTDARGCTAASSIVLRGGPKIQVNLSSADPTCQGGNDGKLIPNVIGGVYPYSFNWSIPGEKDSILMTTFGLYQVTITDALGCTGDAVATITDGPIMDVQLNVVDETCFGSKNGSISSTVRPSIPNWNYTWNNNAITPNLTNIGAGNYSLVVTGPGGCRKVANQTVGSAPKILLNTLNTTPPKCFNNNDGAISINAQGGTGAITLVWNDPNRQVGTTLRNVQAGNYQVFATDANGCKDTLAISLSQPDSLKLVPVIEPPVCFGDANGKISLTVTGGTVPYSSSWSNSLPNNLIQDNLARGSYRVTLTDNNGCLTNRTFNLIEKSPTPVNALLTQIAVGCDGLNESSVRVSSTGGIPAQSGYLYSWSNGNLGAQTITNLGSQLLTVTVTDQFGCQDTAQINVRVMQALKSNMAFTKSSCFKGTDAKVAVTNVNGISGTNLNVYSFKWQHNDALNNPLSENVAGNKLYKVTISDAFGCKIADSIFVPETQEIEALVNIKNPLCFGDSTGQLEITKINGENPSFNVTWNRPNISNPLLLERIPSGNYSATITDSKQCVRNQIFSLTDPDKLTITKKKTINNLCFGENKGTIKISSSGGTGIKSIVWENGETKDSIFNLTGGTYSFTIEDENKCILKDSVALIDPEELMLNLSIDSLKCFGQKDGSVTLTPAGGNEPYQYRINNLNWSGKAEFKRLGSGEHIIFLKDKTGCIKKDTILLISPPPISIVLSPDTIVEFEQPIQINSLVTNGVGDIQYKWTSPWDIDRLDCDDCRDPIMTPRRSVTLTLEIKDDKGCESSQKLRILVRTDKKIMVPTGFTPNDDGENDRLLVHGKPDIKILDFKVFNSWGAVVFQNKDFLTNDSSAGWDGQYQGDKAPSAAYTWVLEVLFQDGTKELLSGDTTLLR